MHRRSLAPRSRPCLRLPRPLRCPPAHLARNVTTTHARGDRPHHRHGNRSDDWGACASYPCDGWRGNGRERRQRKLRLYGSAAGQLSRSAGTGRGPGYPSAESYHDRVGGGCPTVVQHLFFRSQPAASPTLVATVSTPPDQLALTDGATPTGWLWVVLGLGAIALAGSVRIAAGGTPKYCAVKQR
jgi:hypothetical protein